MPPTIGRRRFLIAGGAAIACPPAARAQQDERLRRVAILMPGAETDPNTGAEYEALRDALRKLGWIEGRTIELMVRWSRADGERRRAYASELASVSPDVIVAGSAPVALTLKQATTTIPIVFAGGSDPVANGLVPNLARPGGNVTGFPATEPSLGGKWLELVRLLAPNAARVVIVEAPENPLLAEYGNAVHAAAQGWTVDIKKIEARDAGQISRDIGELATRQSSVLLVLPGAATQNYAKAIVSAAARHRLPAVYPFRVYTSEGGMMSYGADLIDLYRRSVGYVDRILRGEKPGNLPVQLPTKFELVINLRTAKAAGLTIPTSLLVAADEVIE